MSSANRPSLAVETADPHRKDVLTSYFKDMGEYGRLDRSGEIQVAKRIHDCPYTDFLITAATIVPAEDFLHQISAIRDDAAKAYERYTQYNAAVPVSLEHRVEDLQAIYQLLNLQTDYLLAVADTLLESDACYARDKEGTVVRDWKGDPKRKYGPPIWVADWGSIEETDRSSHLYERLSFPSITTEHFSRHPEAVAALSAGYQKIYERCSPAYNEFITANLRLVIKIAKQEHKKGYHLSDLIQEGNKGLMRAGALFDYRRGYKFSTYSSHWIRQAITRFMGKNNPKQGVRISLCNQELERRVNTVIHVLTSKYRRVPTENEVTAYFVEHYEYTQKEAIRFVKKANGAKTTKKSISLDAPLTEHDNTPSKNTMAGAYKPPKTVSDLPADLLSLLPLSLEAITTQEMNALFETVLSRLLPREEFVLRMHYGLGKPRNYSLDEIGDFLFLTRERVRQVETKALLKIKGMHGHGILKIDLRHFDDAL